MELKSGLSGSWCSPGTLLIVPNGIEIDDDVVFAFDFASLLIVPNGIEIAEKPLTEVLTASFNRTKWN